MWPVLWHGSSYWRTNKARSDQRRRGEGWGHVRGGLADWTADARTCRRRGEEGEEEEEEVSNQGKRYHQNYHTHDCIIITHPLVSLHLHSAESLCCLQ